MPVSAQDRPTSPHLSIYRWQITSVLSITHRLTGLALYAGSGLLALWLAAAAYSPECYADIKTFLNSWLGQLMLIGWTLAFYYHLSNGIRHLAWDAGYGFTIPVATRTGWAVVFFTVVMTALTWMCVWGDA
jgi:succinate dehydrogenase / fumarate reductase cytochrome b subunit